MNTFEARIEAMDQRLVARLESLANSVEVLTRQVGLFTEGLTRLDPRIDQGMQLMEAKADQTQDRLVLALERMDAKADQTQDRLTMAMQKMEAQTEAMNRQAQADRELAQAKQAEIMGRIDAIAQTTQQQADHIDMLIAAFLEK